MELSLIITTLKKINRPSKDEILEFESRLQRAITKVVQFNHYYRKQHPVIIVWQVLLETDNLDDICPLLKDAAFELIDEYIFPVKTNMVIGPNRVSISQGYRREWKDLITSST